MATVKVLYNGDVALLDQISTKHLLSPPEEINLTVNEVYLGVWVDVVIDLVVLDDLPLLGSAVAEWADGPRFHAPSTKPQVHIQVSGPNWTMWTDTGQLEPHISGYEEPYDGVGWLSPRNGDQLVVPPGLLWTLGKWFDDTFPGPEQPEALFEVVQRGETPESTAIFLLEPDNWDDHGFETQFLLRQRVGLDTPELILGRVKIGFRGQERLQNTVDFMPKYFGELRQSFYSVGTWSYYTQIAAHLSARERAELLGGLGDVVADNAKFQARRAEAAFEKSLFRDTTPESERDALGVALTRTNHEAELARRFQVELANSHTTATFVKQSSVEEWTEVGDQMSIGLGLAAWLATFGYRSPAKINGHLLVDRSVYSVRISAAENMVSVVFADSSGLDLPADSSEAARFALAIEAAGTVIGPADGPHVPVSTTESSYGPALANNLYHHWAGGDEREPVEILTESEGFACMLRYNARSESIEAHFRDNSIWDHQVDRDLHELITAQAPASDPPRQPQSVTDVQPLELSPDNSLNEEQLASATRSAEVLLRQVRHHLNEGSWSVENGFALGLAEDITTTAGSLEGELRRLSGDDPDLIVVARYTSRLQRSLLELQEAKELEPAALETLKALTTEALEKVDGVNDLEELVETIDTLATMAQWDEARGAFDGTDEQWEQFLGDTDDPYRRFSTLLGFATQTNLTWQDASRATTVIAAAITGIVVGGAALVAVPIAVVTSMVWFLRARLQPALQEHAAEIEESENE